MAYLVCEVKACAHNGDGLCSLSDIQVDGDSAWVCDQTCCLSFSPKSAGQNARCSGCRPQTAIDCEARRCVYNETGVCQAERVRVSGCKDHVCSRQETECSTFICRE